MKKIINSKQAPNPIGPYSQAILVDNTLFISGQVPINSATGKLEQTNIKEETHQVMKNLEAILKESQMNFSNIVKCSIFVSDLSKFAEINEVYGSYFKDNYPARETIQVAALPLNANVEISAIAVK